VTNSDAFDHIHRQRDSRIRQQVETWRRHLDAFEADLDAMLRARRLDVLAPGSGLAGGGRGSDISDPTGNTAIRVDRTVERWARFDLDLAQITAGLNGLTSARQAELADPTPTGLCRHGDCPEKKTATRGVKARDGMPRCEACYKFWCLDVSDIDHPLYPREERPHRGARPRRIGLPAEDRVA
jgi:hypothetical protein